MTMVDKERGKRLRQARLSRGLSGAECQRRFGWNQSMLSLHESGSRSMDKKAAEYALRLRVSLDWLLHGKGSGPKITKEIAAEIGPDALEEIESELDEIRELKIKRLLENRHKRKSH